MDIPVVFTILRFLSLFVTISMKINLFLKQNVNK